MAVGSGRGSRPDPCACGRRGTGRSRDRGGAVSGRGGLHRLRWCGGSRPPDRRCSASFRRRCRPRGEGRGCRQGGADPGEDRCACRGTDGRRQRRAGPVSACIAGSRGQGVRTPEAAVREKIHEPGRTRTRRSAVQGHAGAGFGANRSGGCGAGPIRLLCRQGALRRGCRRGPDRAGRHGHARPAAVDAV